MLLNSSEFLDVPWYDDDFTKLLFRLLFNTAIIFILVRVIYYPLSKRKDYLFTYMLIGLITFFICFTLKKFDLELGMALGLFAIFGILRYRTDTIPIKEMTYLFIVIGVSVINALSNKKVSHAELLFSNAFILFVTYGLERLWLLKHEAFKLVVYEKIDLIKPEKYKELKADLELRTGLKINRVEIGKIDFLRDVAQIQVFYYKDEQEINQYEERPGTSVDDE